MNKELLGLSQTEMNLFTELMLWVIQNQLQATGESVNQASFSNLEVQVISEPEPSLFRSLLPVVEIQSRFISGLRGEFLSLFRYPEALELVSLLSNTQMNPNDFYQEEEYKLISKSLSSVVDSLSRLLSHRLQIRVACESSGARLLKQGEEVVFSESLPWVHVRFFYEGNTNVEVNQIFSLSVIMELLRSLKEISVEVQRDLLKKGERLSTGPIPEVIRPVLYDKLQGITKQQEALANNNIGLLLDISMQMIVELGRTNMQVRKILALGEGSIIELDKLAGEPVDLFVNKKLIAKGEVVVIDENFGVRITEIVSSRERLESVMPS